MKEQNGTTWTEGMTPVSLIEIAELAGVSKFTARSWSFKGELPEPQALVSGRIPVWPRVVISTWLAERAIREGQRATEAAAKKAEPKAAPKPLEDGQVAKGDKVYVDPTVTGFARKRTTSFVVVDVKARGRGLQVTVKDDDGKTRVVRGSEISTEPFPTKGAKAA